MGSRRTDFQQHADDSESSFGGFLRSLVAGVPWSERADDTETLILDAPERCLRLNNANGCTRVIGEARDDIEVVAAKTARAESPEAAEELLNQIRVLHSLNDDSLELEIDVPRKWNRRGYANLELRVPCTLLIDVTASNGKVIVSGIRAAVRARSTNGSVCIDDVVGDVDAGTTNAKVTCTCTCGRLLARSSNGKIELVEHRGSIDASTSNGLIRVSLDEVGGDGVQLATSNGRIVLELPDEVDAEVDIRVDNGIIRNDRPLCKVARETVGQVRGRLGTGGTLIKLRTSNGSISLR